MKFLCKNNWLTVQWNSFLKQLNACVMKFHFETTDWLCDGIPFVNSWLPVWYTYFLKADCAMEFLFENNWMPVWWNSISKQLTDCAMEYLLWTANLLFDGIPFWTADFLFDGIAFKKRKRLTVRLNSLSKWIDLLCYGISSQK